ncbi:phage major capsid protein [Streptomyces sp. BH104]|uniref:phage major capsid protein n=1 Tax=Streptomyces sp. BH104 TaxID=3410407 RepID=UPI003BB7D8A8
MPPITEADVAALSEQVDAMSAPQRERRRGEIVLELGRLDSYPRLSGAQRTQQTSLKQELAAITAADAVADIERARILSAGRGLSGLGSSYAVESGAAFPQTAHTGSGRDALRDAAMRTLESAVRAHSLPEHAAERVESMLRTEPPRGQTLTARWTLATGADAYRSAFAKLLADPVRGHLLWSGEEGEAYRRVAEVQSEMRAMNLTDGAGGYMVPLTLDPAILLTSAGSNNPLRQIARVEQTATDSWNGVSSAGATAEWKTEAVEAADGSPTLVQPSIPAHFGDSFVPYSFEVGMDAVDFLGQLQGVLVDAADQLMATAYTTGTGTGQPTGIVTALAGTSSAIATAVADTVAASDVFNVQNALPPRFSMNAQWCANIAIINTLKQFESTNGAPKFPEIANGQLLGKPLNECSNMDGSLTAGQDNHVLVYGDFSNFVIVDRIGTTLELIPNLVGANRRPTGQRGALLWFRTGSDSIADNAFRVLNA